MTDIIAIRKDAVEAAQKAVEYDDQDNLEEAYKYYLKAADKLNYLSKVDENTYNKETYKKKGMEYVGRAQKLKEAIQAKEDNKQAVPSGGGGG